MTKKNRIKIARRFRRLLDDGILRKIALQSVMREFCVSRASVYNYCKMARVSTV